MKIYFKISFVIQQLINCKRYKLIKLPFLSKVTFSLMPCRM